MDFSSTIERLALAVALGLLVGLQRERASRLAGLRTFALITLLGFLAGLVSNTLGGWPLGLGLIALAIVLMAGNYFAREESVADPGITTEVAALVMYGVGGYLAVGIPSAGVALGVTVAALLAFKVELHGLAQQLSDRDVKAAVQFGLLSLVILPALPDVAMGPYGVVNPRQAWWMVVLIVGVGLTGYVAHKFVPARAGIAVSGLLGGLVSSTATSVSCARNVVSGVLRPGPAAAVVMIASCVSLIRILFELAVAAPVLLWPTATSMLTMFLPLVAGSLYLMRNAAAIGAERELSNPSQLRGALLFAALYVGVSIATAAVHDRLGTGAIYWLAVVSGLTDVDAMTLSTAHLVSTGVVDAGQGWRIVLTAAAANLFGKAAFVGMLGNRTLLMRIAVPFGVSVCAAAAAVWLRP